MSVTKTRTSTLWGAALDWAVATCNALPIKHNPMGFTTGPQANFWVWDESPNPTYQLIGVDYSPSNKWEQAGPLMVRDDIYPSRYHGCAASNPDKCKREPALPGAAETHHWLPRCAPSY